MDSKIVTLNESSSVYDAIRKMVSSDTWSLIVDKEGVPLGVVTDRDIFRRCLGKGVDPSKMRISDVMSSPIVAVAPDERLGRVMDIMVEKNIRRVFVVESGKIIGRVTQTRLFDNTIDMIESLSSMRYQL